MLLAQEFRLKTTPKKQYSPFYGCPIIRPPGRPPPHLPIYLRAKPLTFDHCNCGFMMLLSLLSLGMPPLSPKELNTVLMRSAFAFASNKVHAMRRTYGRRTETDGCRAFRPLDALLRNGCNMQHASGDGRVELVLLSLLFLLSAPKMPSMIGSHSQSKERHFWRDEEENFTVA